MVFVPDSSGGSLDERIAAGAHTRLVRGRSRGPGRGRGFSGDLPPTPTAVSTSRRRPCSLRGVRWEGRSCASRSATPSTTTCGIRLRPGPPARWPAGLSCRATSCSREWRRFMISQAAYPDIHFDAPAEIRFPVGTPEGNEPGTAIHLASIGREWGAPRPRRVGRRADHPPPPPVRGCRARAGNPRRRPDRESFPRFAYSIRRRRRMTRVPARPLSMTRPSQTAPGRGTMLVGVSFTPTRIR